MEPYSSFMGLNGNIKDLKKFEELKKDSKFVNYLAKKISHEISFHPGAEDIAKQILKVAQNDVLFAGKISNQIKATNSQFSDETKTEVDQIIRNSSLLSPTKFYGTKRVKVKQESKPSQGYVRKEPQSIMSDNQKDKLAPLLKDMVKAITTNQTELHFNEPATEVLEFLQGNRSLDNLHITKENSQEYLTAAKLWDHAMAVANYETNKQNSFPVSSYQLRTSIAKISYLPAHEVYLKSLDPNKFENWSFLEKQSNWHPDRAQLHAKIIETNIIKSLALSRRLNTEKPSVWAVRGNTGAGKTYALSKDAVFSRSLDDQGQPSGAINTDNFKGTLKKATPQLTHAQLHKEGAALSFQYATSLAKEAIKATMIIDMRLAQNSQVKEEVIDRANMRSGDALLMDIETPITTSINRVLLRTAVGEDPIVPLIAIKQGYEDIKGERAALLSEVKMNDTIKYFMLYINDENGQQKLAAKKENGKYEVIPGMEEAVKRASERPTADQMDMIFNQKIDDAYINLAKSRDHISDAKIGMIERWRGYTVREALEKHARGESP